jgi:hypothetical protein
MYQSELTYLLELAKWRMSPVVRCFEGYSDPVSAVLFIRAECIVLYLSAQHNATCAVHHHTHYPTVHDNFHQEDPHHTKLGIDKGRQRKEE